jgi:hypothetical protein
MMAPAAASCKRCYVFDPRRNSPHVAGWIENSSRSVTPKLILRRREDPCSAGSGTLNGPIHVRHVYEYDDGRTPIGRRCAAGDYIEDLGLNHEERIVDAHRDMNWRAIWTRSTHLLDGAERRSAEVHFRFNKKQLRGGR